jgi:arsenate reductase-like glutaredoxin family protein
LRRFVERFGARQLVDEKSRHYREAGMAYISFDDDQLVGRLLADQRLIRLPLVRHGWNLSVGVDEPAWRSWLAGC